VLVIPPLKPATSEIEYPPHDRDGAEKTVKTVLKLKTRSDPELKLRVNERSFAKASKKRIDISRLTHFFRTV